MYAVCVQGGQKEALDFLELELQMSVSQLMEVLQTELGSSGGRASVLNHWSHLLSPTNNFQLNK